MEKVQATEKSEERRRRRREEREAGNKAREMIGGVKEVD